MSSFGVPRSEGAQVQPRLPSGPYGKLVRRNDPRQLTENPGSEGERAGRR